MCTCSRHFSNKRRERVLPPLEAQLQIESARAQTAEQERSALIQTLVTTRQEPCGRHGRDERNRSALHSEKGIAEQDFGEWTHKVRAFMLTRFGGSHSWCSILGITSTENRCQMLRTWRDRLISLIDVFGEGADEEDQIDEIDDFR